MIYFTPLYKCPNCGKGSKGLKKSYNLPKDTPDEEILEIVFNDGRPTEAIVPKRKLCECRYGVTCYANLIGIYEVYNGN